MWLSKAIRRSPPHLPIGGVAPKQRHHEDFDLAFDRGLDHQIVAVAGEGDDVAADLAVGLVWIANSACSGGWAQASAGSIGRTKVTISREARAGARPAATHGVVASVAV
jgi:hypothetical protein